MTDPSAQAPRRRHRRVARTAGAPGESEVVTGVAAQAAAETTSLDQAPEVAQWLATSEDDTDRGWGSGGDSNDDRLRRDVPPHWGR